MLDYVLTALAIVAAFGVAAILVAVVHAVVHRSLERSQTISPESRKALHERATRFIRSLRLLAFGIAALGSISFALSHFGITEPAWDPRAVVHWLLTHGINLVIIIVGAAIVIRAANFAIEGLQQQLSHRATKTDLEWQRRASTLGGILTNLVTVTVWFVAILMVLRELSIDVLPILTGAGIAGLAIGFGAQNLVRDIITGFFLILEDQVRVGDIARINGVQGMVEQINLRTIAMRDGEGAVQVFPNGTITTLANLSKQFAFATVDVKVAYNENIDRVIGTMREVGASIEKDPAFSAVLLAPLEITGVESLEGGVATIRAKFKTLPLNQGRVASELRRRLMVTFVGRRIRPFSNT
jgi:small conductance mechanosensitive channel